MEAYYLYIKSLHIIFVITWFAGLFYIPRLYIYIIEAYKKPKLEQSILSKQLLLMLDRLWHIITWPSAILATIFAILLLVIRPVFLEMGWLHIKLTFVFLLILYHLRTYTFYKILKKGTSKWSSNFMRIWNEGATILLFSIIFLVVLKSMMNWILGILGLLGLIISLMFGIKLYKKVRKD